MHERPFHTAEHEAFTDAVMPMVLCKMMGMLPGLKQK
jgi:hypothetical protein